MTETARRDERFDEFVLHAEPRLRRALGAGYGATAGREATVDALVWAWNNWARLIAMSNPVGYLYRVGQTSARRGHRRSNREHLVDPTDALLDRHAPPSAEADLVLNPALAALSEKQRTAVVLVHGFGVPLREVAEIMDVSVATVREHSRRALGNLRTTMEVTDVH